jgi:uncharacterized protein
MEKLAKSDDPKQQALRDAKKNFNMASKEWISRFIAFKRGLNGRGDNKYNLHPSRIQDPMPPEVLSFLHQLIDNFQRLTEAAAAIAEEQNDYSRTRQKSRSEMEEQGQEAPKQAASSAPSQMIKLASFISSEMKTGTISFPSKSIKVLVAETPEEQMVGLMYCEPPLPSMAFPYQVASYQRFWMKNTKAPLDILFCRDYKIEKICRAEPFDLRLVGSDNLSDFVIELPAGEAEKLNLKVGDEFRFQKH